VGEIEMHVNCNNECVGSKNGIKTKTKKVEDRFELKSKLRYENVWN
jgi:hypothetical protein